MFALYKLIKNPKTLWRLYLERAERWKRERTLTVDVRKNLAAEEGKLVKKVERLIAAIEDGPASRQRLEGAPGRVRRRPSPARRA